MLVVRSIEDLWRSCFSGCQTLSCPSGSQSKSLIMGSVAHGCMIEAVGVHNVQWSLLTSTIMQGHPYAFTHPSTSNDYMLDRIQCDSGDQVSQLEGYAWVVECRTVTKGGLLMQKFQCA